MEYFQNTINTKRRWLTNHTEWYQKGTSKKWAGFDRVYFVTLSERLENVKKVEDKLGIKNSAWIFKAIHKDKLNKDELYEKDIVSKAYGNGLDRNFHDNLGRIACHLSHLACINHFLKDPTIDTCVIFEDDLQIPNNGVNIESKKFKEELDKHNIDWNIIYLGYCYERGYKKIADNINLLNTPKCRHAYVLNKKSGKYIIDNTLPMTRNGDVMYTTLIKNKILSAYGPRKLFFWQNPQQFKTLLYNNTSVPLQYAFPQLRVHDIVMFFVNTIYKK